MCGVLLLGKSRRMICSLLTQEPLPLFYYRSSPAICKAKPSTYLHSFSSGFLGPISSPTIRAFSSKPREVEGMASSLQNQRSISYLTQREAAEVDETLMRPLGFSVDQLMVIYVNCLELAGLSVATSIAEVCKPSEHNRVLAICGPGNNGGDGLVAARHLRHFVYKPFVCYPKRTPKPLYSGLVTQLESLSVTFLLVDELPVDLSKDFDILVDAMFGFSFHDIPSGWHVEEGDVGGEGIKPDMLGYFDCSKMCAKKFSGPHHFLGGRFVPQTIAEKYKLQLPQYPGTSMCVRIGKPPQIDISALIENYISPEFLEEQFRKWFDDVVTAGLKEPNAMALSTTGKYGKPDGSTIGALQAPAPIGILKKIWELFKKCQNFLKNFALPSTKYDIHAYDLSSSRLVLLKGVDKDCFVWYTNYGTWKARELSENPHASLLFYWDGFNRQAVVIDVERTVRVEASVQKVSDEESEQYSHSRPRGSQIGAIVSK
ncbi:hypothetical protein CRYUN_Cryun28dG0059600 [Craigia yunnanensis]